MWNARWEICAGRGCCQFPESADTPLEELEQLVRPAGYFRQKAARLKRFVAHLDASHGGSLEEMFARPAEALREELLGLPGIGPETADSILLYAASREVFVVDSYTRRIFERHELASADADYDEIRLAVEQALASNGADGAAELNGATLQPANDRYGEGAQREEDVQGDGARGYAAAPVAHVPSVPPPWSAANFRGAITSSTR